MFKISHKTEVFAEL